MGPRPDLARARRRRAGAVLALAALCIALSLAVPAGARPGFAPPRSTTTTRATTTTRPTTTSTTAATTTTASSSTTTAPTTTTTVAPSPCGTPITKADGTPWQCTFHDDFDGTTLNAKNWMVQTTAASGFHSGAECFVNTPNNVSVANGVLSLTARKEAAPFTCASPAGSYTTQYTSGETLTYGLFSQAYGRFEVRAKLPAATVKGLQTSFWLWPDDMFKYGYYWPQSGEIDIAEEYSLYPDRVIPFIHYVPAALDVNVTNNYCLIDDISQFHTYAAEWTPTEITIKYDGQTCLVDDWNPASPLVKPQPFDQPFMVALTQALGIDTNQFDPATTPLPATTQVDYVRVWK